MGTQTKLLIKHGAEIAITRTSSVIGGVEYEFSARIIDADEFVKLFNENDIQERITGGTTAFDLWMEAE